MSKRRDPAEQVIHDVQSEAAEDPLLTPTQAARLFGVVPQTAWRWAAERRIPSVRCPSGLRKIRLSELEKVLGKIKSRTMIDD